MKKRTKVVITIATILGVSAVALAQFRPDGRPEFGFLDQDGDGKITKEEVSFIPEDKMERLFMLDVNQDGVVDKKEFENPPNPPEQAQKK